jgi:Rrf2 family protein
MLSQTAEYALRAVIHLAQHPGEPCTVESIAKATQIPVGYLAKIMQQLSRAGLSSSQRGLHGGFTISRNPSDITLFDAVDAVDPFRRIHACPLSIAEHGRELCSLHRRLDGMLQEVEARLRATTIASLLADPAQRPLCRIVPKE